MRLEQIDGKRFVVSDNRKMIGLAVDVYSAFFIKDDFHLTKREKEFFIGCVSAFHDKVSLHGSAFTNYMINVYKFANTERAIYNMRDTIKNKRWLIQTTYGYDIPPLFKNDISNLAVNLKVSMT